MHLVLRCFLRKLTIAGMVAAVCWLPLPVFASADPEPMTLTQAIYEAVENNPAVKASGHQTEAAGYRIPQAQSAMYPQVSVSESYRRTNTPMWAFGTKLNQQAIGAQDFDPDRLNHPDGMDNYITALNVSLSLFNGGRNRIGIQQAKQGKAAADLGHRRVVQATVADAATAYLGLMLAVESLGVVEQALETAQAHHRMVKVRYDSGFVVKSDLLRAQVRIAELEQQRLRTRNRVHVANAFLNTVLGRSVPGNIHPTETLENCRPLEGAEGEWLERAAENRPELNRLQLMVTIAEDEVKKAEAGRYPTVNLMGAYQLDTEDFDRLADSYTIGAMVQLNVFSGNRIPAEIEEKKASLRQVREGIAGMKLAVRMQTREAYSNAESAWKEIDVAKTAVDFASEGLRIVGNRYQSGLLTIVDLMDAEVALQMARHRHYQAMHNYKAARVNLHLAAGTIDPDFR